MLMDKDKIIIKKDYEDKSLTELIRISNHFVDDFLFQDNKIIDIPINALRIIFNIISVLRNEQFSPYKNPKQLSLFEDDFETENNTFVRLKIKNSRISHQRSTMQIKDAYEFLAKFRMGWYTSTNSKGKEIKTYGGFISIPSYQERGYTSFLISSYWLKKILVISEYNYMFFNLVFNIRNNKHILFALWLLKIPDEGTKIKLTTVNFKFGINYKNSNDLCEKFLKPIRQNLNKFNDTSFNYKYDKELIFIIPYSTKNIQKGDLTDSTNESRLIRYRLNYLIKRYCLDEKKCGSFIYHYKEISKTRHLIDDSYKIFLKKNRKTKVKSVDFKGEFFLYEIQRNIIDLYRETETGKRMPNAYPLIL